MMPLDTFQSLTLSFKSEQDPATKEPINLTFGANDFTKVTGETAKSLFKQAAFEKIQSLQDHAQKVETSVKY